MYKFSLFRNYLPLEKRVALHVNKLDFPPLKDALCQVWLKLGHTFWRRIFLISSMYLRYFVIISPWKKAGPFIWRNPFTQGCFVPSLIEIDPVVLEKKMKMWKVYDRRRDRRTDDGQKVIRKVHMSFQFSWANKSIRKETKTLVWTWLVRG